MTITGVLCQYKSTNKLASKWKKVSGKSDFSCPSGGRYKASLLNTFRPSLGKSVKVDNFLLKYKYFSLSFSKCGHSGNHLMWRTS